jgi:hypothetical protein
MVCLQIIIIFASSKGQFQLLNDLESLIQHLENMSRYTIIISTVIESVNDSNLVAVAIAGLKNINEWSIDLEDCDKVIRIIAARDISNECCEKLALFGIKASVMEVFDEKYHLM